MSKRLLKIIVSLAIFSLLFYLVDLKEIITSIGSLTPLTIFYLIMVSVLLVYLSAIKWSYFIDSFGLKVPVFHLFNLYLVGYFVNLLAPSYIGGDVARSWYVGKKIGQHNALTATILERYTGLVAMLGLATIFIWVVDLVTWPIRIVVLTAALGIVAITLMALSDRSIKIISKIRQLEPLIKHVIKIQDGLRLAKRDKPLLIKALLLSFLFHSFTVVNVLTAAAAIGWIDPPIIDLFVVLPLILLIGAIPLAPNGLGLQEGAYLYFLTGIGATPSQALAIGIILRAKGYILAILGGVVWFCLRIRKEASRKEYPR